MAKKIKFAVTDPNIDLPSPARQHIPEWYKSMPRYLHGDKEPKMNNSGGRNLAIKTCVPFLDGFTQGYQATLWQDLVVSQGENGPDFAWGMSPSIMDGRDIPEHSAFPVPAGHLGTQLVWLNPFMIETPPGYSVLITHPLNRYDLPFTTLGGIIDSDAPVFPGHLPFYIHKDFAGVIPAGTPIFQIIPFKRENWEAVDDESLIERAAKRRFESLGRLVGHYKNTIWQKKSFD